jgi:hypothetical protein
MSSHKIITPATPINYAAVLADLQAKRVQLNSAIASIRVLMEQTGIMRQPPRPFRALRNSLRFHPMHLSALVSLSPCAGCWK